jgi:hypothetical protein
LSSRYGGIGVYTSLSRLRERAGVRVTRANERAAFAPHTLTLPPPGGGSLPLPQAGEGKFARFTMETGRN